MFGPVHTIKMNHMIGLVDNFLVRFFNCKWIYFVFQRLYCQILLLHDVYFFLNSSLFLNSSNTHFFLLVRSNKSWISETSPNCMACSPTLKHASLYIVKFLQVEWIGKRVYDWDRLLTTNCMIVQCKNAFDYRATCTKGWGLMVRMARSSITSSKPLIILLVASVVAKGMCAYL